MGKFGRKRKQTGEKVENPKTDRFDDDKFVTILSNPGFETYYRAQNLVSSDSEFVSFLDCCQSPLPVTFRMTGNREHSTDLIEFMKQTYFGSLTDLQVDNEIIQPPQVIPWYPNSQAWVFNTSRAMLKKSAKVAEFHRFLVSETEVGNISRQEEVSMIPVLLLDVKPGHAVLDMCAAPGSKTAQLIEAVDCIEGHPSGIVIANDVDASRAHTLVHQVKRLQSPCLLVTNHPAQSFPRLFTKTDDGMHHHIQYDRILCDVPCSGDGTIRKNKTIWRTWDTISGIGLHSLQSNILDRGCRLLKVGGRIVYSTCSFNPIENEAVVADLLNKSKGSFRLVDVSGLLPALKRNPGLSTWKVFNKDGVMVESFDSDPELPKRGVQRSHFPPSNASELHLEKCVRILPHLQNSGGFFVAVLEKVSEYDPKIPSGVSALQGVNVDAVANAEDIEIEPSEEEKVEEEEEEEEKAPEQVSEEVSKQKTVKKVPTSQGWVGEKESPFLFIDETHPAIKIICDFYGIHPSFPRDLFVVRSADIKEETFATIYTVSRQVKTILTSQNSRKLKLVNAGVKLFKRNGKDLEEAPYRVCSEGVSTIMGSLSPTRQLHTNLADFLVFLKSEYPKFDLFSKECKEKLEAMKMGTCLVRFDPKLEPGFKGSLNSAIVLPFYRAYVSASLFVNRKERTSMLQRLTGEVILEFDGILKKPKLELE